jgi:hypothetical protein
MLAAVGDAHETEAAEAVAVDAPARPRPLEGLGAAGPAGVLALQRIVGNAAVSRMVAARRNVARLVEDPAAGGIKFTNPDLQAVFDANKPGTKEQLAAMRLLDQEVKGVWSKLDWVKLRKSAAQRVYNPNMMAQGPLGTCGPATVLNFLDTNDPQSYALLVLEVFRDGKARTRKVNSKLRDSAPQAGMDSLDWMLMSAVQDITNDWYDYYGTPEDKREGTSSSDQRWMYKKLANVEEAKTLDTPKHDDVLPAAKQVNGVVGTAGVSVNMHVSASVLQNPASAENERNHVIRLLKPITIVENADDSKSNVEFDAFTWGQIWHWKGTVNQFIHMIWGFTIASTKKGVI